MTARRIAIASDHGGFACKQQLAAWLDERGYEVEDLGTHSDESVDYPDFALPACERVVSGQAECAILVCGTGIGMAIAANKVAGIRAANVTSEPFAALARQHNDANVLTLSGRFVSLEENERIVETFLATGFEAGRHERRIAKIARIEKEGRS